MLAQLSFSIISFYFCTLSPLKNSSSYWSISFPFLKICCFLLTFCLMWFFIWVGMYPFLINFYLLLWMPAPNSIFTFDFNYFHAFSACKSLSSWVPLTSLISLVSQVLLKSKTLIKDLLLSSLQFGLNSVSSWSFDSTSFSTSSSSLRFFLFTKTKIKIIFSFFGSVTTQ